MPDYHVIANFIALFDWMLFSLSLFVLSKKLRWPKRSKAWVPGLRFYEFGKSVGMPKEGAFCGIMDALFIATMFANQVFRSGRVSALLSLVYLVFCIFVIFCRIQIFVRLLKIFGLRNRWLLLWLLSNWLPLLIIGLGDNYQPRKDIIFEESWEAGLEPAVLEGSASDAVSLKDSGLSIKLKDRTVKDFGKKRYLLKDIALNIPKNSLVLLLGGSGSGKTTLINAVIGYEKANATVLLNGADVYRDYDNIKYKIGFVPQQNLIRSKDTVIMTVNDAAKMRLPKSVDTTARKNRVKEVMDLLGLTAGKDGLVAKKSGGQLRRICIAMELVSDPELFVLDEPDSGLDGVISREIFTKLRQIADEGRIVIVITHTPDRVIDLFDKVIVLGRDSGRVGRLAFYGTPQEAREFFGRDSMEQIIMCVNRKEEGGEGRADEMIEKYAAYAAAREGGLAS